MKKILVAIMACAFVLSFSGLTIAAEEAKKPAQSGDDIKWVDKCVKDNKFEGQPADVVRKYCECMNEKMDDNETQSVTQWEKAHPKEQKECDEKAGWK
jgi:hypothetical protein